MWYTSRVSISMSYSVQAHSKHSDFMTGKVNAAQGEFSATVNEQKTGVGGSCGRLDAVAENYRNPTAAGDACSRDNKSLFGLDHHIRHSPKVSLQNDIPGGLI